MRTRSQRALAILRWGIVVGLALSVMFVFYIGWRLYYSMPLTVDAKVDKVIVDTQRFGEYSTEISRVRLSDAEDRNVVWEAVSTDDDGMSSVWRFVLISGDNQVPEKLLKKFRTITPMSNDGFVLKAGRRYRIEIWGPSEHHHNARSFIAPPIQVDPNETLNKPVNPAMRPFTALAVSCPGGQTPALAQGQVRASSRRSLPGTLAGHTSESALSVDGDLIALHWVRCC